MFLNGVFRVQDAEATSVSPATANLIETAKTLKNSYEEKKNFALSAMSSHRDIVRSLKQKKASAKNDNENEKSGGDEENSNSNEAGSEVVESNTAPKAVKLTAEKKKFDMLASDFLKKRIDEIKSTSKSVQPKSPGMVALKKPAPVESIEFELEIVIGETTTNRKLMDKTNDDELPSLSLSVGTKRKRNEPASVDDDDDDELSLGDELSKKSKTN